MIIENTEALYDWMVKHLQPLCVTDPVNLAKYVITLIKKANSEEDLKKVCLDQLEVFLSKDANHFVESLFETMTNKSYLENIKPTNKRTCLSPKSPLWDQPSPAQSDSFQGKDVRNLRNMAEKQRRDKLNAYINELAGSVPLVTNSPKRLDKTSVLRLSAAYLRLNKTTLSCKKAKNKKNQLSQWKPTKHRNDFWRSLIDTIEGFIIVTTGSGKIIYVSHSVENFLGHQNIEMIGYCLTSFLHPSDIELAQSQIQFAHDQLSKVSQQTSDRISFQCRLREKNQPRCDVVTYQMVNVSGFMTTSDSSKKVDKKGCVQIADTAMLFKGFVQVIPTSPMAELSLMDADLDEYVSRHALDGTLLFADHRISGIIGFLPSEVYGKSAYNYILPEDHTIALFAQKLMFSNSNGTGTIVHRLRTSGGSYVFLQSSGCLQYDKNGQIDHWVCVSRLLVPDEGDKQRDKFVKRFTPHIYNISPTALYESLQIVMGPRTFNHPYSTSKCVTELNKCDSNSAKIIEMDSPPPTPSSQQSSQKAPQICTTITSTQSALKAAKPPPMTTISIEKPHTAQPLQQMSVTSTQMPINSLISHLSGADVQSIQTVQSVESTPVVQIQTVPIIPINSTQILTQQTVQSVNGLNNTSNFSRCDSISSAGVINLIAPTPVSYVKTNTLSNNSTNNSSVVSPDTNNLFSDHSVNVLTKPAHDFTHLLGATVLTFDAQNRPVISVYSPNFAFKEQSNYNNNNINTNNNNNNNNPNLNDKKSDSMNTNLLLSPRVNSSVDSSAVSPSMDTSFYSPSDKPMETTTNETNGEQWSMTEVNCEEVTNQSTNSSLDFSFPSNDSQCDFGLIEDQLFGVNILEDPFLSSCAPNGNKRPGFSSDENELDTTVEAQASMFDFQNTETDSSVVFTSKTNSN